MSVLETLINAPKIAGTPLALTHAAAMLATLSVLMGVAVMTLMSVPWVLTSAPKIATTLSVLTPVAVEWVID